MTDRSPLRTAFDRAERLVGEPLESAVATATFMDAVAGGVRLLRGVRQLRDAATAGVLHRFNLPAYSDIRTLTEDMRRLEARVRELSQPQDAAPTPRRPPVRRRRA